MHIRWACIAVLCVASVASAGPPVAARITPSQTQRALLVGKPAPDLDLTTLDGKTIKLSSLKGQVVVLDFWATWCVPCEKMLPQLNRWHRSLKAKGLVVIGISQDDKEDDVRAFTNDAATKFEYPVALDLSQEALRKYRVQGLPMTTVIDKNGIVRFAELGLGQLDHIQASLADLLKK